MGEEITITKDKFQLVSAEACAEVITEFFKKDEGKTDVEFMLMLSSFCAIVNSKLMQKLFRKEN